MKISITSFFTPNYRDQYDALHATATEFGLSVNGVERRFDTWADAVSWKPFHILQQLYSIGDGEGLLWTDADSRFRTIPDFRIFEAFDLAFAKFRWSKGHNWEYLSGTMFFRNTSTVRSMVEEWAASTEKYRRTDTPEQNSLREVFDGVYKDKLRWLNLPIQYVFIEPDFRTLYPGVAPVISHLQASRTNKK